MDESIHIWKKYLFDRYLLTYIGLVYFAYYFVFKLSPCNPMPRFPLPGIFFHLVGKFETEL